jgi:hypothetical protein
MGVENLGKLPQIISWHVCFLLRPQPDEDPREHAGNQLKDLLDGYPIRL